jgi:hypothetical protein
MQRGSCVAFKRRRGSITSTSYDDCQRRAADTKSKAYGLLAQVQIPAALIHGARTSFLRVIRTGLDRNLDNRGAATCFEVNVTTSLAIIACQTQHIRAFIFIHS